MTAQAASTLTHVNQGFRTTSAGVKLGRILFDPNLQTKISPSLIAQLLRQAGLPIPKGAVIGADVAQLIMSGGSIVTDFQTAKSVGDVFENFDFNFINAGMDLLGQLGLIDPKSPAAQVIKQGTDLAMVVSSGGLNILADLALIFDIIGDILSLFHDYHADWIQEMHQSNRAQFSKWINAKYSSEQSAAVRNFTDYQSGKLTVFQMLGSVAEQSPELFDNYFPKLKSFFPLVTKTQSFQSSAEKLVTDPKGFPGWSRYEVIQGPIIQPNFPVLWRVREIVGDSYTYQGIDSDHRVIQKELIECFLRQPWSEFEHIQRVGNSFFENIAVLSLFPPYFDRIDPKTFDTRPLFLQLGLTPHDMENDFFQARSASEIMRSTGVTESASEIEDSGLSINGYPILKENFKPQASLMASAQASSRTERLASQYDRTGKAASLLALKFANDAIKDQERMIFGLLGPVSMKNYWSVIALADTMRKDPYFTDFQDSELFQSIPTKDFLEEKHRKFQFLSVSRKLNNQAKANIAGFYGKKTKDVTFRKGGQGHLAAVI